MRDRDLAVHQGKRGIRDLRRLRVPGRRGKGYRQQRAARRRGFRCIVRGDPRDLRSKLRDILLVETTVVLCRDGVELFRIVARDSG